MSPIPALVFAVALAAAPVPAAETGPPEGRLLRFPDIHNKVKSWEL